MMDSNSRDQQQKLQWTTSDLTETLLNEHPEWDEAAKRHIQQLQAELQALQAENQRLRKAILAQRAKGPKMSTKLRDALYE